MLCYVILYYIILHDKTRLFERDEIMLAAVRNVNVSAERDVRTKHVYDLQ